MSTAQRLVLPIYGQPKPQSRPRMDPRTGAVYSSGSPELRLWRATVEQACRSVVMFHGVECQTIWEAAADGIGYACELTFCMPTKKADRWGKAHTMRPDTDNLAKAVMDSAVDGGLLPAGSDEAIHRLIVNKVWVPEQNSGVVIELQAAPKVPDKSTLWPVAA